MKAEIFTFCDYADVYDNKLCIIGGIIYFPNAKELTENRRKARIYGMTNHPTETEKSILWELSQVKASVRLIHNEILRLNMLANGASDDEVLKATHSQLKLVHEVAGGYYKKSIKELEQHKSANFPPPFSDN